MSLKSLRQKRGWTQQQLADHVPGINQARVATWETGRRKVGSMSLDMAIKLCDALRVSNPRKLLDDSPAESSGEDESAQA